MEIPINPVKALEDERKRFDLFQSFWDRRCVALGSACFDSWY